MRTRADIGMLFQKSALFDSLTVAENVGYRFVFGSVALAPILWRHPVRFRGRYAWLLLLTASVVGVPVQFLLQFNNRLLKVELMFHPRKSIPLGGTRQR